MSFVVHSDKDFRYRNNALYAYVCYYHCENKIVVLAS